ncbi:DUF6445 family protein [Sphingomonas bacterium]|uniref:DUF6445 family protein n=1 Tax=Sphingomonas bacterium TaxID=1895847 RepID=UPI0020C7337C|nr:DUF6445 family protein [Sphingomonas bacterium]
MARYETMRVGDERRTVIVIDEFSGDPDALREAAAQAVFEPARHAYPGLRAALPEDYWPRQAETVARAAAMLGLAGTAATLIDASFSIVTTPRDALSPAQRLPHCDSHERSRVAFVHYLDNAGASSGTAFFRHRSTRFETVDSHRVPIFDGQLDAELRYGRPPVADYIGDADRLFERIAVVPARYDRAVVYHSFALHSGVIPADASLSADPAMGRLTVTGFVSIG